MRESAKRVESAEVRLLGLLPQPAMLLSVDGTIVAANQSAAQADNARAADLAGRTSATW